MLFTFVLIHHTKKNSNTEDIWDRLACTSSTNETVTRTGWVPWKVACWLGRLSREHWKVRKIDATAAPRIFPWRARAAERREKWEENLTRESEDFQPKSDSMNFCDCLQSSHTELSMSEQIEFHHCWQIDSHQSFRDFEVYATQTVRWWNAIELNEETSNIQNIHEFSRHNCMLPTATLRMKFLWVWTVIYSLWKIMRKEENFAISQRKYQGFQNFYIVSVSFSQWKIQIFPPWKLHHHRRKNCEAWNFLLSCEVFLFDIAQVLSHFPTKAKLRAWRKLMRNCLPNMCVNRNLTPEKFFFYLINTHSRTAAEKVYIRSERYGLCCWNPCE